VGEVERTGPGAAPPGLWEPPPLKPALPPSSDPHGIARSSEAIAGTRSRYLVRGLRHAVSTASRFFGYSPSGAEAPEASMDFGFPSGHTETIPPEPCGAGDPPGVLRLYSDISAEIH
jgi:hypothetical protein